jgi:hypothetical protein
MLSLRWPPALNPVLEGINDIVSAFNRTARISCHCGRTKAHEGAHGRSAAHVIPKQRILIQLGDGIASNTSRSSRCLTIRPSAPPTTSASWPNRRNSSCPRSPVPRATVRAALYTPGNRIRPVHYRICLCADAVGYVRNEIAKRDRLLRDAASVAIPCGVRQPSNRV